MKEWGNTPGVKCLAVVLASLGAILIGTSVGHAEDYGPGQLSVFCASRSFSDDVGVISKNDLSWGASFDGHAFGASSPVYGALTYTNTRYKVSPDGSRVQAGDFAFVLGINATHGTRTTLFLGVGLERSTVRGGGADASNTGALLRAGLTTPLSGTADAALGAIIYAQYHHVGSEATFDDLHSYSGMEVGVGLGYWWIGR